MDWRSVQSDSVGGNDQRDRERESTADRARSRQETRRRNDATTSKSPCEHYLNMFKRIHLGPPSPCLHVDLTTQGARPHPAPAMLHPF